MRALVLVLVVGCGFPRPARVDGDARPADGSAGDPPAQLSYPANPAYFKKFTAATPDVPVIGGGPVETWSVSPALPMGLTLDATNGTISGTPMEGAPMATYTVTAANAHGMTTADVKIRVNAITQIADGDYHACAIDAGAIVCWGDNQMGECGNGVFTMGADEPIPVDVMGSSGASAVAAGEGYTCAVINGGVFCWGRNQYGQIGTGQSDAKYSTPQQVVGLTSGATAVAAAADTACAVVNGNVYCWGRNQSGQLGNNMPSLMQSATPVQVIGISGLASDDQIQSTSTGRFFCALKKSANSLLCWGENDGQILGVTGNAYTAQAMAAPNGGTYQYVATGVAHICAAVTGVPYCWGLNAQGETGDTTSQNTPAPTAIPALQGTRTVAAGHFFTCAIKIAGVLCFGQDNQGQLGNGMQLDSATPQQAMGITGGTSAIAAGGNSACSLVDGDVKCWGDGSFHHLGNGTSSDSATPVDVIGL